MKLPALLLVALLALPLAADVGLPKPTIFDGYPTPAPILRGFILAESGGRARAVGDDGISRGGGQLNRRFDRERTARWGAFDPYNLADSIRITSCLFRANMYALLMSEGCIDPSTWETQRENIAIAAHRQGLRGALENGVGWWYVERVRQMGEP